MLLGDTVTHEGRTYVVVGFTPMSVTPAEVQLRDPVTGETFWTEQPGEAPIQRAALRLARNSEDELDR